jgi:hypothetical protein
MVCTASAPARLLAVLAVLCIAAGSARAEDAPAAKKTTQSESYVVVEPLYATILDNARPRGLLLVEMGLDVPDATFRSRVSQSLPVLRDAYMRSLLLYAATAVRPWRQPSVEDIAGRLQAVTDQVMGKKGARVLMAQTAIRITR